MPRYAWKLRPRREVIHEPRTAPEGVSVTGSGVLGGLEGLGGPGGEGLVRASGVMGASMVVEPG